MTVGESSKGKFGFGSILFASQMGLTSISPTEGVSLSRSLFLIVKGPQDPVQGDMKRVSH